MFRFFRLLCYVFLKNYYTRKDGYYIKFSSKYHQISGKFTIYYLEDGKYICCFDGTVENKVFKLDLDKARPFGENSISSLCNLNLPQIRERVRSFINDYYPDIKYN